VAAEIGEVLPHWQAAGFLLDPGRLANSAKLVTLTIVLLICLALATILAGGTFVALDARRQFLLARQRTDFVSNVSHELKTPLTSIRMFAELLERDQVADPEKRSRYLRIIALESERLTKLINNVLDFARMERGARSSEKAVIDLEPVLRRVWEAQVDRLQEAGFVTEWLATELPPWRVNANGDEVGQVVMNLLSNAEKYSGERREITVRSTIGAGEIQVAVLDRGVGVPAGERRRIFGAFHRGDDSLASGVQGSGLGLALAKRIAEDHGGRIDCAPREGGGTVFTLTLPMQT
jgi:signal transduction histidine kinase